jgi:hypothetical protein
MEISFAGILLLIAGLHYLDRFVSISLILFWCAIIFTLFGTLIKFFIPNCGILSLDQIFHMNLDIMLFYSVISILGSSWSCLMFMDENDDLQ